MDKISDSELIMLCRENIEDAEEILNKKYDKIIKTIIKNNMVTLKQLNIAIDDLYTECFEVYRNAVDNYSNLRKACLNTYVTTIINRKIKKSILNQIRKNKKYTIVFINDLMNNQDNKFIIDNKAKDPLDVICEKENIESINNIILQKLNIKEINTLILLTEGFKCSEIAKILKRDYYCIYRTIKSIRRKLIPELI